MNKTNILALADFIEGPGSAGFDIAWYDTCICGKKNQMLSGDESPTLVEFLGLEEIPDLDKSQFVRIASPPGYLLPANPDYTAEKAVAMLRNFAETGEIVWGNEGERA